MHLGGSLGLRDAGDSLKKFSREMMVGDGVSHPHRRDVLGLGAPDQ